MEGGRAHRGWRDPDTERTGEDRSSPGASFPVTASSGISGRRRSLVRGRERFSEKGEGRNRRKKGRRGAAWWWPPTAGLLLELRELLLLAGMLEAGAAGPLLWLVEERAVPCPWGVLMLAGGDERKSSGFLRDGTETRER